MIRLPDSLLGLEQPWNVSYESLLDIRGALDDTVDGNRHLVGTILTEAELLSGLDAVDCYFQSMLTELPNHAWVNSLYPPPPRNADGFVVFGTRFPINEAARSIDDRITYLTDVTEDLIDACLTRYAPECELTEELRHQTYLLWLDRQLENNPGFIISCLMKVCPHGDVTPKVTDRCLEVVEKHWRDCPPDHPDGDRNFRAETWSSLPSLGNLAGRVSLPLLDQIIDESRNGLLRDMAEMVRNMLRT